MVSSPTLTIAKLKNLGSKDLSEGSCYHLSHMIRGLRRGDKHNVRAALEPFTAKRQAVERPIWIEAGAKPQRGTYTRCLSSGLWIWLLVVWGCVIGMGGWVRNGPNGPREEGVSMWLMHCG